MEVLKHILTVLVRSSWVIYNVAVHNQKQFVFIRLYFRCKVLGNISKQEKIFGLRDLMLLTEIECVCEIEYVCTLESDCLELAPLSQE